MCFLDRFNVLMSKKIYIFKLKIFKKTIFTTYQINFNYAVTQR